MENINRLIDWANHNRVKVFYSQPENTTFLKYGSPDWKFALIKQFSVNQ